MSDVTLALGKAGFVLFTLGLLIGAFIPKFRNRRMGLSAHLTAVQAGTFLIAVGLFWQYLSIPMVWHPMMAYALLASSYALVIGLVLAAALGASRVLPIAGEGFAATKSQELIVAVIVLASSTVMFVVCVGICFFMVVG